MLIIRDHNLTGNQVGFYTAIAQMTVTANTYHPLSAVQLSLSCCLAARREQSMPIYDYFTLDNYYDRHDNQFLQA